MVVMVIVVALVLLNVNTRVAIIDAVAVVDAVVFSLLVKVAVAVVLDF